MFELTEIIDAIRAQKTLVGWLLVFSAATFLGSLLLVPLMLVRLPADYFSRDEGKRRRMGQGTFWWPLLIVAKNILGFLFLLAGIAMLVLPGQGLLTIMVGIILMDFPGKYRLMRWIIERPKVAASVNWLRKRANRGPLKLG